MSAIKVIFAKFSSQVAHKMVIFLLHSCPGTALTVIGGISSRLEIGDRGSVLGSDILMHRFPSLLTPGGGGIGNINKNYLKYK